MIQQQISELLATATDVAVFCDHDTAGNAYRLLDGGEWLDSDDHLSVLTDSLARLRRNHPDRDLRIERRTAAGEWQPFELGGDV